MTYFFIFTSRNKGLCAKFRVDALGRYLEAREFLVEPPIQSLSDLPDFEIVSTFESLSLKSEDLRNRVVQGFIYDYQFIEPNQFVISASPVGFFSPKVEFGMTESGDLRVNLKDVDVDPDSHEEVLSWSLIKRSLRMRSKNIPKYLD